MEYLFGRPDFADAARAQQNCFLLTNGLGGYCSLSAAFSATRGDHALLMACPLPPTERIDLVHRLSETLETAGQTFALSTQDKTDGQPEDGWRYLVSLDAAEPCWTYQVRGVRITRRVAMAQGNNTVAVQYTLENATAVPCTLAALCAQGRPPDPPAPVCLAGQPGGKQRPDAVLVGGKRKIGGRTGPLCHRILPP